jgi:hypothetical protein
LVLWSVLCGGVTRLRSFPPSDHILLLFSSLHWLIEQFSHKIY